MIDQCTAGIPICACGEYHFPWEDCPKGLSKARIELLLNPDKPTKVALLSVWDKEGITEFAQDLKEAGFILISSGGTAKHLRTAGLRVVDVADITGFPAILDHRVVTLHPKIHGGILAKRTEEHEAQMAEYKIPRFDLVCVDLYPVFQAILDPDATVESVMELTDIGGPTMIRGAAKNHNNGMIVICDPADRATVINELNLRGDGTVSEKLRLKLAAKVFGLMARYDAVIWQFLSEKLGRPVAAIFMEQVSQLAYAENRDQNPAFLWRTESLDPLAIHHFQIISGDPSYIAIADSNGIIDILCTLAESFRRWQGKVPYIVVAGKHGNPCGASIDWEDAVVAVRKALHGDSVAIMGGEVVTNFPISNQLAEELYAPQDDSDIGRKNWGLDLVVAPSFSEVAADILGQREKRRLLANSVLKDPTLPPDEWSWKPVRGGFLQQKTPNFILTPEAVQFWTNASFFKADFETLLVAWAICWKASSNTVALAKDRMLIGLGCGQQDRIACVRLCLERAVRAGHNPVGSYFASDAFFPYASSEKPDFYEVVGKIMTLTKRALSLEEGRGDVMGVLDMLVNYIFQIDRREGPELLVAAGCYGGVVPADGKNLDEVKKVFTDAGMMVGFVAPEHRGFAKH